MVPRPAGICGADDAPDIPDRIRAAKAAGLDGIEFWKWSDKDLDAVRSALDETGLSLAGILCEPIARITDVEAHGAFLDGVRASLLAAIKLGAPVLIAQAGDDRLHVRPADSHPAQQLRRDAEARQAVRARRGQFAERRGE